MSHALFIFLLNGFFIGSLLTGAYMLLPKENLRRNIVVRVLIVSVVTLAILVCDALLHLGGYPKIWVEQFFYVMYCNILWVWITVCYKLSVPKVIHTAVCSFLFHQGYSRIPVMIRLITGMNEISWGYLSMQLIAVPIYLIIGFTYGKKLRQDNDFQPDIQYVIYMFIIVACVLPLSALENIVAQVSTTLLVVLCVLQTVLSYAFIMFQYYMYRSTLKQADIKVQAALSVEQAKQLEQFKLTQDMMNIKLHDLKYQIKLLSGADNVSKEVLEDLKKVADDYQAFAQTGNQTMDIIFTEKMSVCQFYNIRFEYSI